MSPIKWPEVGKVAPHYLEHGIILLDEAAKLQAMARQKPIPINVISPFIDSLTEYVRKTREQPTMQELLMEIRNGFKETRDIHEKVTIIKQSWTAHGKGYQGKNRSSPHGGPDHHKSRQSSHGSQTTQERRHHNIHKHNRRGRNA
jgi:hypothetical protein